MVADNINGKVNESLKNNKEYRIFIPDELAKKFDEKLMQIKIDADTVIADFVREWVDDC